MSTFLKTIANNEQIGNNKNIFNNAGRIINFVIIIK